METELDTERILVVDDKPSMRHLLESTFVDLGLSVTTADSAEEAISHIRNTTFAIVITDLNLPGEDGMAVLRAAKATVSDCEVIVITAFGTIETAVEAMRLGAADFISKPFQVAEMERRVEKLLRSRRRRIEGHSVQTWIHPSVQHFVGASDSTRQLLKMITKIAKTKSSVLVSGPSGVGKELVARAMHEASPRRDKPFVAVNCAALAPTVLESELFGHEKGAFTGADKRKLGRFERAHGGTLFLDEVGEIDPGTQVKLLRVLQEGELERVGGTEIIPVDVRIIAATNRDLKEAIESGDFREDFYYRLNVFSLHVPPLKERRDDIPLLVDHFLRKYSLELGKEVLEVDDDVIGVFLNYPWPGNVRELENVIERAVVLADGESVTRAELPPELIYHENDTESEIEQDPNNSLQDRKDRLESALIQGALDRFRWNKTKAAEHLGLKRTTLQYKIKKYSLE